MGLIETNFINKEISQLGDSVTIRIVTKTAYSKWGDATETTSDTTNIKCMINVMSESDQEVKEGILKTGDIRFWFKASQTINRGDRIQWDSKWYEVDNIIAHRLSGTTYIKEVRVQKV